MNGLRPYPSYKPSDVDWLGDIPEHWEKKPLKYLASINDEALSETTDPEYEISYVDISSVEPLKGIVKTENMYFEGAPSRARRRVQHGDTIVSTVRTYLRAIAPVRNPPHNMVVSTGFAVVRPRKIAQNYLSYALQESRFVETIVAKSVGVSYPAVNASDIANIYLQLPPEKEQKAIADFLDRETAKIDALMAKKQELIDRLKEKRTALITRTVTRGLPPAEAKKHGLNPNPSLKPSGIDWLGNVPEHWKKIEIKRLAQAGKTSFIDGDWVESPYITNEGIRLIQTGNVGIGLYKEQGFRYISEESFHELKCTEVIPGDILICRLAEPVGRACIAPSLDSKMITSVDVVILKPKKNYDSKFLVYWFSSSAYLDWLAALCRGSTRDRISRTMLGDVSIAVPDFLEQKCIVDFLDQETAKIDALIQKVDAGLTQLQEYRAALITAAVTGKIDVRKVAA